MKKFLIIQLLLFYCFISFSQEAVNYKVKFTYGITGDKPCDDVSNEFFYFQKSASYNCTMTVTEPLSNHDTTYNVHYGSVKNYTCSSFKITVSGSVVITWEHLGPGQSHGEGTLSTESVSFDEDYMTIDLNAHFSKSCGSQTIPLSSGVVETCSNSHERIHKLNFYLDIMPSLPLNLGGSKVCTGDEIILKSLDTQPEHDWYAIINGYEWFTLDLDQAVDTTTAEYIYSKAPLKRILDDGVDPPEYYYERVKFMPGDQIQFIVDHGCYGFDFGDNPRSAPKTVYPKPVPNRNSINVFSPSCVGGIDGKIKVGLVDGLSPTYFKYGLFHYALTTDTACEISYASGNEKPILVDGNYYCPSGISGNFQTVNIDPNIKIISIDTSNCSGDLDTISAGIWQFQIEHKNLEDDSTFCNQCAYEDTIIITDPDPFVLNTLVIPKFTYADSTYNVSYFGGYQDVEFTFLNGSPKYYVNINETVDSTSTTSYSANLKAGNYNLFVKDSNNCICKIPDIDGIISLGNFSLKQPAEFKVDSILQNNIECNSKNAGTHDNGMVEFYVSGGIGPYSLKFNKEDYVYTKDTSDYKEAFSIPILNRVVGKYPYLIKPNFGTETKSDTIYITEPNQLIIHESDRLLPVCQHFGDGEIRIYSEGGTGKYEYFINDESKFSEVSPFNVDTFKALSEGVEYLVKLQDSSSCSETDTFVLSGYLNPIGYTKGLRTPPNCIGGNDGSITLQGFGGHKEDGIYDDSYFSLNNYADESLTTQSPEIKISNLYGDSIYSVTIIDKIGCEETDTIYLGEEPNPVQPLLLDSAEERCFEYNDGWVLASGTSGEKPAGGYNYYISDVGEFTVNHSEPIDTSIVKSGEDAKFYNLVPGWHSVYISDKNDCLNEVITAKRDAYRTHFFVEPQDLIQYEYDLHNSSTVGAQDGYLQVTISGGNNMYEYQLIDKVSMAILETGKNAVGAFYVDSLKEGDYSLQFKDSCGCSNGALEWINYDFTVLDPVDSLKLDILQVNKPSCSGFNNGSVDVRGKYGWGYYEYGIDSFYSGNTIGKFEGLASGYYTICVKDKEGAQYCEQVYVGQPDILISSVEEITNAKCHNGSDGTVTLDATGGTMPYYYSIDDVSWQIDSAMSGFSKGVYTLYIKDANECKVSMVAEVEHPDSFTMNSNITNTACGESLGAIECTIAGGTPPYNYSWFMVDVFGEHQISESTSIASNLAGGKYKLSIMDSNLCDTSWVFIVNNTDGPELTINNIDSASCSGMTDGAIHYSITQGIAPYYVELISGTDVLNTIEHENSGTYSFTGLTEGQYSIMVRDSNACVQSSNDLKIDVPNPIVIVADVFTNPLCLGYNNGFINVHAEGGNGNYVYEWSTGASGNSIHNLASGNYTVTATDIKGCNKVVTYEITDPEKLKVDIGDKITLCEGQTYPLSADGFASYNWTFNGEYISSSSGIEVWAEGEYILQVTNINGCLAQDTFVLVLSNDLLEAEFIMPSEAYVNDTVVAIDISWPEPENTVWSFSPGIKNISSETYFEEFTFENPGIYTISLTSYIAMCVDSVSKQIVVLADTSNNEKSILGSNPLIKYFNVFPNPNNGEFSVEVELDYATKITVEIFSLQQNTFVFRQKGSGQSYYKMEYGFTNLQQGIYLVILYVGNEKRTGRILII